MYIYKTLLVFLLFAFDTALSFTNTHINTRINTHINTRIISDTRRYRSYRGNKSNIQIYIKRAITDLSGSEDRDDNYSVNNNSVSAKTRAKIDNLITNIMNNCENNGKNAPEVSISNLQKYCSPTNIIKNMNTKALTSYFKYSKYSLLLGKYANYEIIEYTKNIDSNDYNKDKANYIVDMKVSAPYKTMLKNSIKFNEMYYPKIRNNNNICYVIYRWTCKKYKYDDINTNEADVLLEGCYLVPPQIQL
jgi:hypothetical protein